MLFGTLDVSRILSKNNTAKHLVRHCSDLDLSVRREAIITIRKLSGDLDARNKIYSEGVLEPLVDNFDILCRATQIESLRTILALIRTADDQHRIREVGVIPLIVDLIERTKDDTIKAICLEILCRLTHQNSQSQMVLSRSRGLSMIHRLLNSEKDELKSKASRALSGLCSNNQQMQAEARDRGLVKKMLPFLDSDHPQLRKNAVITISDLVSGNKKNQKIVLEGGCLERIISFLDPDFDETTTRSGSVSSDSSTGSYHSSISSVAAAAIASLAEGNKKIQKEVKEKGGLNSLVEIIKTADDSNLLSHSIIALAECIRNHDSNINEVIELDIVPSLKELLSFNDYPILQFNTCLVFGILSESKEKKIRKVLVDENVPEALQELSSSGGDHDTGICARWALSHFENKRNSLLTSPSKWKR